MEYLSPGLRRVLAMASEFADRNHQDSIGGIHILCGAMRESEVMAENFGSIGVTVVYRRESRRTELAYATTCSRALCCECCW